MDRLPGDVGGEHQERNPDEPERARFDPLLLRRRASALQTPQQDRARAGLDEAVHAEADERDAAGGEAEADADQPLQAVPGDGEDLETTAAPQELGPVHPRRHRHE